MSEENETIKLKAIDVCQGIINRMASNSFKIKTWTVTLVVATLLVKQGGAQTWIAFIPLLVFWGLDAWFLRRERMYRDLYNEIITGSLKTGENLLGMNAERFKHEIHYGKCWWSRTLGWFYGSIVGLVLLYWVFFPANSAQ
jgi:hypothetical protein